MHCCKVPDLCLGGFRSTLNSISVQTALCTVAGVLPPLAHPQAVVLRVQAVRPKVKQWSPELVKLLNESFTQFFNLVQQYGGVL